MKVKITLDFVCSWALSVPFMLSLFSSFWKPSYIYEISIKKDIHRGQSTMTYWVWANLFMSCSYFFTFKAEGWEYSRWWFFSSHTRRFCTAAHIILRKRLKCLWVAVLLKVNEEWRASLEEASALILNLPFICNGKRIARFTMLDRRDAQLGIAQVITDDWKHSKATISWRFNKKVPCIFLMRVFNITCCYSMQTLL